MNTESTNDLKPLWSNFFKSKQNTYSTIETMYENYNMEGLKQTHTKINLTLKEVTNW